MLTFNPVLVRRMRSGNTKSGCVRRDVDDDDDDGGGDVECSWDVFDAVDAIDVAPVVGVDTGDDDEDVSRWWWRLWWWWCWLSLSCAVEHGVLFALLTIFNGDGIDVDDDGDDADDDECLACDEADDGELMMGTNDFDGLLPLLVLLVPLLCVTGVVMLDSVVLDVLVSEMGDIRSRRVGRTGWGSRLASGSAIVDDADDVDAADNDEDSEALVNFVSRRLMLSANSWTALLASTSGSWSGCSTPVCFNSS